MPLVLHVHELEVPLILFFKTTLKVCLTLLLLHLDAILYVLDVILKFILRRFSLKPLLLEPLGLFLLRQSLLPLQLRF